MNPKLAAIFGQMVCEINCWTSLANSEKANKLKALAQQIQITNTSQGPMASGIKPAKTRFKVTLNAEIETSENESELCEKISAALEKYTNTPTKVTLEPVEVVKEDPSCPGCNPHDLCPKCDPVQDRCLDCLETLEYCDCQIFDPGY